MEFLSPVKYGMVNPVLVCTLEYLVHHKCSKILITSLFLFSNKMLVINQGWSSQNAFQNSKQGRV